MPDTETLDLTNDADVFADLTKSLGEFGAAMADADTEGTGDPIADDPDNTPAAEPVVEEPAEERDDEGEGAETLDEPSDEDRLAALAPINYVVDGQTKDFPGIRVYVDGEGKPMGFVGKIDALPALQARLSKADYYEANFAGAVDKAAASKLNALEFTDGAKQTHRGAAAMDAALADNAKMGAALALFAETIENPEKLIALAYAVQNGDQSQFELLKERLQWATDRAVWTLNQQRGQRTTERQQVASAQEQRGAITSSEITNAVDKWAGQFPALTAEDKQDAIAYFGKLGTAIVRPPSPEEQRQFGIPASQFVTDHPVIHAYLANLNKARVAANASARTQQTVTSENAARAARTQAGKKTGKTATPKAKTEAAADTSPSWDEIKAQWSVGNYHPNMSGAQSGE